MSVQFNDDVIQLACIVNRVTFHNPENGWSVLRVQPLTRQAEQETVIVHQTKVFAGATMEFTGQWVMNAKFGRQFRAIKAVEKKPATTASIEKYIGSGLIKGIGPKTAKTIVRYFKENTLDVFDHEIERLMDVPGIAEKKLVQIKQAWKENTAIRDVMMFLQDHGISTLFAVKIFKLYGDKAIARVKENPYQLARDFYGIGFFSADKVALSLGFEEGCQLRLTAAIQHVLAASREEGHCYLTYQQVYEQVVSLLELEVNDRLLPILEMMEQEHLLKLRLLPEDDQEVTCYYSKSLYYDEDYVAKYLNAMKGSLDVDRERVLKWVNRYCQKHTLKLSEEQIQAVAGVVSHPFAVLTGGPGCGKTTTTLVIVKLLEAIGKRVLLAAPTGRATQRMSEVIGREAKTLHRLLEWKHDGFQKNQENPLQADFIIVDECSMLDVNLSAALFRATPKNCQVLWIGDADQLPSVGAGNLLKDIISSEALPCFRLTQIFRQAKTSSIIQFAHKINAGVVPKIPSPFYQPDLWRQGVDCLFLDSDQATKKQLGFIANVKRYFALQAERTEPLTLVGSTVNQGNAFAVANEASETSIDVLEDEAYEFRTQEVIRSAYEDDLVIPDAFKHVNLEDIQRSEKAIDAFRSVLKKVHPWSSLHYKLSALDVVKKLYCEWIPKYYGDHTEIQILTPMTRGTLGATNLNQEIQAAVNPKMSNKAEITVGGRLFRVGDRVIHRRNNYDLNVYNGDIGRIADIDNQEMRCVVVFMPGDREVHYQKEAMLELDLAYAITIHKSQGSEFEAVIMPVLSQHFKMLYRNLIYTGLTRAKKLCVMTGTRRALAMAVHQRDQQKRQTGLQYLLKSG